MMSLVVHSVEEIQAETDPLVSFNFWFFDDDSCAGLLTELSPSVKFFNEYNLFPVALLKECHLVSIIYSLSNSRAWKG